MIFLKKLVMSLLMSAILCGSAFAAENIVYVNADTGSDENTGGKDAPFATLEKAVSFFDGTNGGGIVVCSSLDFADR